MSARGGFRNRSALRVWEDRFGPNMTPMVDVVLVILIFFMTGSTLLGPEWFLSTAVPRIREGPAPAADPFALPPARFEITLSVDAAGRTVAGGLGLQNVSPDALAEPLRTLAADGADLIVLIRPAPDVPYRDVVHVHDLCTLAGVEHVGIADASP